MTPAQLRRLSNRLEDFLEQCFDGLGRRERREALCAYLRGLLLDGERKSMVPIAARLAEHPDDVEAIRQRIQEAVSRANWDEREVFRRIGVRITRRLPGVDAFVVDDTGFPKKGRHSVGVQRQYSGTLGRIDNCQIATSLHLASEAGGACIGMRLFLPERWASDAKRRAKAGIPEGIHHKPKWQISLDLIDDALEWGLPPKVVVADSGYGDSVEFREGLVRRGLSYVVSVTGTAVVWPPGVCPIPPPPPTPGKGGRRKSRWTDPPDQSAIKMAELAKNLPKTAYRRMTWREGTKGKQWNRFAFVRIRTAHKHAMGRPPGEEQWLICEWPKSKKAPTTYYLSNLPASTSKKRLVYLAKLRWRIERDYQELKGELGLDHFEGRGWRGFHHHVACVAAAHAFLTLQRALFPPQDQKAHISGLSSASATSAP